MRANTGRAVSASIVQRLRQALATGESFSYQQLAEHADCTVRSVRNYLAASTEVFGFPLEKTRNHKHEVLVRARVELPTVQPTTGDDEHSDAVLRALLPDPFSSTPQPIVVVLPNLPRYGQHQVDVARTWAECTRPQTHALRVRCPAMQPSTLLWPRGVLVHHQAGVVLAGFPLSATAPSHLVTIALHNVPDAPDVLEHQDVDEQPAAWMNDVCLDKLLDLPFCSSPSPDIPSVDVHVRFEAYLTERLRLCVWHRSQRVVLRTDGRLDVRFGPVPLPLAASWAASFGASVTVMGNKQLRKAVKKRSFTV